MINNIYISRGVEDEASSTNIDIDEHGDYEALNNDYVCEESAEDID